MRYKKVETYQFSVPQEFKAYLDFKADLQASGVTFTEEGGSPESVRRVGRRLDEYEKEATNG